MLRRAWKPTAAAAVILLPSYYVYRSWQEKEEFFDLNVRVRGPDGKPEMTSRTLPLLPMKQLEARLREHATFQSNPRPGGLIWKHTTAALASNDPIEDANSHAIIQRDPTDPSAPGDLLFFTVFDGHGGFHTSQLLSKILINAVVLELSSLVKGTSAPPKSSFFQSMKSTIWSPTPTSSQSAPVDGDPRCVSLAIQQAFAKLDSELINAPLRVLANSLDENARKTKTIPDLSQHPMALATMLPAISGSCALMAVLDTAHRDLYVACTGDSRAVAGIWEESTDGGDGKWKVEVLSEDQTGRNPNELKRIQSEHPADEAPNVIREGRILGGLEPSRAFGDARYKWPAAVQDTLSQAFMVGNGRPMRPPPRSFKTPPYVIARPVVTHRKLSFLPSSSSDVDPDSTDSKSTLRFIVLATDGLWDELSSEEVVSLVGGHLSGLKGTIPKSKLADLVPTTSGSMGVDGKNIKKFNKEAGSWAFLDENLSAHLIRNAFGGGDERSLRKRLSIPAPLSRRYRDDVTVTVVWWEDGREDGAKITSVKSKL